MDFYNVLLCYSLGEACSHVAAILFKVEYAVRNGYTALTSQACTWNNTFCKNVSAHLMFAFIP